MKTILIKCMIFLSFTLLTFNAFSQQTLNVAGNSAKINGMSFEYSIGEMTIVSTERNANLIVTQGFLQPSIQTDKPQTSPGANNLTDFSDQIKVYPNPTQNILFVETYETQIGNYSYQLFDGVGKIVLSQSGQTVIGLNKFSLDLHSFAGGNYHLMLRKLGPSGEAENYSYKIQKLN
jgi:hypothetical protein